MRSTKNYPSVSEVREVIPGLLDGGHPTIRRGARSLGVSVRTLQRRLGDQQHSWGGLVREGRLKLAEVLLLDPTLHVRDIASSLGFADPSSFSRFFHASTGVSPRRYRRRLSR
jgi:AraC-like DNA-binding protein